MLILLLICESLAWVFRFNALKYHSLAREGMRRAMIADGLGQPWDVGETQNFAQKLDARLRKLAEARETSGRPSHFTTNESPGLQRLHLNLLESVFWQKHLYRRAAQSAFKNIAIFVALILMTHCL